MTQAMFDALSNSSCLNTIEQHQLFKYFWVTVIVQFAIYLINTKLRAASALRSCNEKRGKKKKTSEGQEEDSETLTKPC